MNNTNTSNRNSQGLLAPDFYDALNRIVDDFNEFQARLGSTHRLERFPRKKDIEREEAINFHVKNGLLDEETALWMSAEEQDEFLRKVVDIEGYPPPLEENV